MEPVDPTKFLAYGPAGLIALFIVVLLAFAGAAIGGILMSERLRSKAALAAEGERDRALISMMSRNADALLTLNASVLTLQNKFQEHVAEDAARFASWAVWASQQGTAQSYPKGPGPPP